MRFLAVDWGTSRFRAYLVEDGAVLDRRESEDGVSRLAPGRHAGVFNAACGDWLTADPGLPVLLVGMVGSREGWLPAPYVACPAGAAEIAASLVPADLGRGRNGWIVPGLVTRPGAKADIMRGEETHLLGSGVADGFVCLPGTHCKWARMQGGRVDHFATFLTGELYGLIREHSMVGRTAADPPDGSAFEAGFAESWGDEREEGREEGGLLHRLFGLRAAFVTGAIAAQSVGPYLSGLLTGEEMKGALRLFGRPASVTIVADRERGELYETALRRIGIDTRRRDQEATLLEGLAAVVAEAPGVAERRKTATSPRLV